MDRGDHNGDILTGELGLFGKGSGPVYPVTDTLDKEAKVTMYPENAKDVNPEGAGVPKAQGWPRRPVPRIDIIHSEQKPDDLYRHEYGIKQRTYRVWLS